MYNGQFCDYESFQATCGNGELLQILNATYGHMEIGKCIVIDIGLLGCQADVTDILRTECGGKLECSLFVGDEKLRSTAPCNPGIALYLQASYACVKSKYDSSEFVF